MEKMRKTTRRDFIKHLVLFSGAAATGNSLLDSKGAAQHTYMGPDTPVGAQGYVQGYFPGYSVNYGIESENGTRFFYAIFTNQPPEYTPSEKAYLMLVKFYETRNYKIRERTSVKEINSLEQLENEIFHPGELMEIEAEKTANTIECSYDDKRNYCDEYVALGNINVITWPLNPLAILEVCGVAALAALGIGGAWWYYRRKSEK